MAVLQGAVAQFQALIKNFPEFIRLTAGGQGHIRQVDGNNALIEAAIVLRLAWHIVLGVGHVVPASAGTVGVKKLRQPMQVNTSPLPSVSPLDSLYSFIFFSLI